MMGASVGSQDRLFYEFDLDAVVPADHLLRRLDAVLDLSWLRPALSPYYSHMGCPSIDPELMIRMLLIGYCYSIRSERRLCDEVRMNLAYRWFCRLGLEDRIPDHSTFSVNRHGRFRDSDVFRQVFEDIVGRCMAAGLIKGEGFAVDASVIEADASRFHRVEGSEVNWTDDQRSRRPIREYLLALGGEETPLNPKQQPKALSPTDPTAAWTTRGRHKVMFGYSLNYLIDMETSVIVDVEATPTRISKEVHATETMIERTERRLDLKPRHLAGDVAYGTADMLGWLVDHDIEPHIPVWDQSKIAPEGKFTRADFTYDKEKDIYICPNGKELSSNGRPYDGGTLRYWARKKDCDVCAVKYRCTTATRRKISRDINQEARDYAQSLMETEAYVRSRTYRKKIETLFGDVKHNLGLTRLRLRGLTGARDEFLLLATVQNLKRLAKYAAIPPPKAATA
ncbi:MAG: IS1182 family transposase [Rhodospirillaceae bacterium]